MKIKVIDLLNKIANGEEVPKKIKIKKWEYNGENENLKYELFDRLFEEDFELNDEIEILEEEKKIPEKLPRSVTDNACSSKDMRLVATTLNEIIDYLTYLKSKGE